MRHFLFGLIALFSVSILNAQSSNDSLEYCGTNELSPVQQQFLKDFQKNPRPDAQRAKVHYLPVQVHIVGKDDGSGYMHLSDVLEVFCDVNVQYEDADLAFYIDGEINYINNDDYYEHNGQQGSQMMKDYNVSNRINLYFVEDPNGNCGYYSPFRDAVAVAISCAQDNNTTVAHELGHYMSLPHTFSGWESGTPPVNEQEKVNGSNCQTAGDGFCDTPPDYLSDRWHCPYTANDLFDPDGQLVVPDGSYYMSYSNDGCQDKFSPDQIAAMRNFLFTQRTNLMGHTPAASVNLSTPNLISPVDEQVTPWNYVELHWDPVPNAELYHVEVSKYASYILDALDIFTSLTVAGVGDLETGRIYRWRVKPFMATNYCSSYPASEKFEAGEATGIVLPGNDVAQISIYPNPVSNGGTIQLDINAVSSSNLEIALYTTTGQGVYQRALSAHSGSQHLDIELPDMAEGVYLLQITGEGFAFTEKVMVSQ